MDLNKARLYLAAWLDDNARFKEYFRTDIGTKKEEDTRELCKEEGKRVVLGKLL